MSSCHLIKYLYLSGAVHDLSFISLKERVSSTESAINHDGLIIAYNENINTTTGSSYHSHERISLTKSCVRSYCIVRIKGGIVAKSPHHNEIYLMTTRTIILI